MPRCDNCNRFVALETQDPPELDSIEVDDGVVQANVRLVRLSECCGEEKKEYMLDLTGNLEVTEGGGGPCGEHDWYLDHEWPEPELTERWQEKDRHGKPIRNPRYQRHYIGATLEVEATCGNCGARASANLEGEAAAGSFEEL